MTEIIVQLFITATAPIAVFLLGRNRHRSACILGLLSQVGFIVLFTLGKQWLLFIPSILYTISWITTWPKKREKMKKIPRSISLHRLTRRQEKQLKEAAKKAATSGQRQDLAAYLRLRKDMLL